MKRVKCPFCTANLAIPVVLQEEGFCPECGDDLRDLVGYVDEFDDEEEDY